MIRHRVARSQESRFACAACALGLRAGALGVSRQTTIRHHRWYSVADGPRPQDDGPRSGESAGAPANPSIHSSGFAKRPTFGRKVFGQMSLQDGAESSAPAAPRLAIQRDDFLLPHELAARDAAAAKQTPKPSPPPPASAPTPPTPQLRGTNRLPLGVGFESAKAEPAKPSWSRIRFDTTGTSDPPPRPDPYPRRELGPAKPDPYPKKDFAPAKQIKEDDRPEWAQLSRQTKASGYSGSGEFVPMQKKNPWAVGGLGFLASKIGDEGPTARSKGFGSMLGDLRELGNRSDTKFGGLPISSSALANQPKRPPTFGRSRNSDVARPGGRLVLDLENDLSGPPTGTTNAAAKKEGPADEEDFFSQFDKKMANRTKPRQFDRAISSPASPSLGNGNDFLSNLGKEVADGANRPTAGEEDFFAQFENRNRGKPASGRPKDGPPIDADFPLAKESETAVPAPKDVDKDAEPSPKWAQQPAAQEIALLDTAEYDFVEDTWAKRRERPEKIKTKAKSPRNTRRRNDDDEDGWDEAAEQMAEERRRRKAERKAMKEQQERERLEAAAAPKPILVPEFITVANLGEALGFKTDQFLKELANLGFEEITDESVMTGETAALVAQEFGFEPTIDDGQDVDLRPRPPPEDPSELPSRPPIVTIMGHVDHGKTTMLDWLRKSSVAAGEHGGITQHIGAFAVRMSTGKQITFLDTPGHAAFLTMRQRGANITDIVILVVAADDSVKPQTLEALKHAQNAKVPIIVAINKADKPEARIEQVKIDLANNGVELEEYGGDVQVVAVSGKTGLGMKDLEENIITLAEILDMRSETEGMAEGWIIESSIKPLGRAATVLVKRGTLRKGDIIVAGNVLAKIRYMLDESGQEVQEAPPGTPVEVFGWRDAPSAGDQVLQAPDEDKARQAIRYREDLAAWQKTAAEVAEQERRDREKAEADALAAELAELGETGEEAGAAEAGPTGPKLINFMIKGDVLGSVEAVTGAVMEIGNKDVRARVLRSAPGQINESDVEHAATTGSAIINFNNTIPAHIQRLASASGVRLLDYSIIYHLVDAVKALMSEHLPLAISYKVLGEAEVLQVFNINLRGRVYKNIAGCKVRNGQLLSTGLYRVLRDGKKIFEGKLESLKHGKKEVTEIKKNSECGVGFDGFQDLQMGDQIQMYEVIKEKQYL